jgi:dolichol-phosphate mannosyltransferase
MIFKKKIALVIPAYNIGKNIVKFLDLIPNYIDQIYLVDDFCPLKTGNYAQKNIKNKKKLHVIFNKKNLGVGGAMKCGYLKCLSSNVDIIVKIDGDNQMSPSEINMLVHPIIHEDYEYVKGNRFLNNNSIDNYPKSRFYGNIFLSLITKLSSGYWDIYDPINGYTAIKKECLKKLNLFKIDDGYFFETDMLFNLYNLKSKIKDVPVTIKYHINQKQNLSVIKESFNFFFKNLSRVYQRIKINYFKNNFSLGSFFATFFLLSFFMTIFYGGYNYIYYQVSQSFAPTGVILISSISCLIMFLSLMIFLIIDSFNNPNK